MLLLPFSLSFRNLKNNPIDIVSKQAFYPLQSLRYLNLKGNRYKHLPPSLLFLPSLEKVFVDSLNECVSCEINFESNCSSELRRKLKQIPPFGNVTGLCLNVSCASHSRSSCRPSDRVATPSPKTSSVESGVRDTDESLTLKNVSSQNISDASLLSLSLLEQNKTLQSFIFILSISAVLANLIITAVIFSKPQLKSISTLFLAGHIAVCDLLIALYLLVAATNTAVISNDFENRKEYYDNWHRFSCPVIISVRSIGQLVEPVVLFLMTLDRYKRIVNFSKPPLSHRFISFSTYLVWLIAIVVVGVSLSGLIGKQDFDGAICSRMDTSGKSIGSYVERALIASSTILFISCCVMYFQIYRVVKNQNQRMGTQAYVRVSKLIFALVLSTLVLWFVPALAVAFVGHKDSSMKEIRQLIILVSFTTNSLVNPFIYVFREKKFQQVIFAWINRTSSQGRGVPNGKKVTSFRIGVVKDDHAATNYGNSNETEQVCTTSL